MATGEKEKTSNFRQTTPEQKDLDLQMEMELQHASFPLCRLCLLPLSSECLDVPNLLVCRDCPIQLLSTNCSEFNLSLPKKKKRKRLEPGPT